MAGFEGTEWIEYVLLILLYIFQLWLPRVLVMMAAVLFVMTLYSIDDVSFGVEGW